MALIRAMMECIKPGGVLLIALAIPYNPFIDGGELSERFAQAAREICASGGEELRSLFTYMLPYSEQVKLGDARSSRCLFWVAALRSRPAAL